MSAASIHDQNSVFSVQQKTIEINVNINSEQYIKPAELVSFIHIFLGYLLLPTKHVIRR
jgi:hypothetical protein